MSDHGRGLLVLAMAAAMAVPAAGAWAACDTPDARTTTRARYNQAMIGWRTNNPDAYAGVQEQMKKDLAVAGRRGELPQCQVWERYIRLSKRPAPVGDLIGE
ncbi:conserved exported protein of unknown function [Rhodovastum atsumiense]|uniref:Uncharacterized protein n=1 Tax=Rhodovastum atsumiense TaxID=504468 RepID=A0A5M6IMQ7_9PROT|nr:hypothetical protein [Rhodovastum atsumiense]KAA5609247.1 hypothetical protein F1189_25045 [Rhodovastum atsumiense]CAH2601699.1 conserved exported protein of unknown function [Rhodovastum atsumiense]